MPPKAAKGGAGGGKKKAAAAAGKGAAARGGKRKARDEEDDNIDGGGLSDSDDEPRNGTAADEEEEEGDQETAAEKRLRIATAYLSKLRKELAADEAAKKTTLSDDEDEGDEGMRDVLTRRLQSDVAETRGEAQRSLAASVRPGDGRSKAASLWRGHKLSVTALALSSDDGTAWSASKDGKIFQWDVETGKRTQLPDRPPNTVQGGPLAPPKCGAHVVLAAAVSSDGTLLATAGNDKLVHVWDVRAGKHVQAFPGHRGAIYSLSFREGTRTLYSASEDRCLKIWSLEDMSYVDTLYGHENSVLALAGCRRERVVSASSDRTCRLWKLAEDSHLVFNGSAQAGNIECVAWVSANEWVTGAQDGSLARWSALKKKPAGAWQAAHGPVPDAAPEGAAGKKGSWGLGKGPAAAACRTAREAAGSAGTGACESWVSALATAPGSDLLASGAGDGAVRLWRVPAGQFAIEPIGALQARGYVNALAVARSGRFVLAGMGQEPRLGRWGRDAKARNGVLLHLLDGGGAGGSADEEEDDDDE